MTGTKTGGKFTSETAKLCGKMSASRLTPAEHQTRASERGNIVLQRYGKDFYAALRRKRQS